MLFGNNFMDLNKIIQALTKLYSHFLIFYKKVTSNLIFWFSVITVSLSFLFLEWGKIHLRMHAGNLNHGILKPRAISVGDVVGELFFCLLEEFNLLAKLPLHLVQLDLALSGSLLQLDHLGLCLLDLLLQADHLVAER